MARRNPSKITVSHDVDDALEQSAGFEMGADDRQFIDNQIRGVQQHLVDGLIRGRHGSWFDLSSTSSALVAGDAACLGSDAGSVTKALEDALDDAKAALGVAVYAAAPGARVFVAIGGILPPSVTGLVAGNPGFVRVNTDTGRLERVTALSVGDYGMGSVDNAGWLQLRPGSVAAGEGGEGGEVAVNDDVAKSDGVTVDRVRGLRGVPIRSADGVAPPVGGALVYNAAGGTTGYKAKKPVMPGYFDVEDYGAVPDWASGRTISITSGSAVSTVNTATGLRVGQKLAIIRGDNLAFDSLTVLSIVGTTVTFTTVATYSASNVPVVTDNLPYFEATLAAAKLDGGGSTNKSAKIIINGHYFLSGTLAITQTVHLEGCGQGEPTLYVGRSSPGTWLIWPRNCTGLRFHSAGADDISVGVGTGGLSAEQSTVRNMLLWCKDTIDETLNNTGHGIHATATIYAEKVTVEHFAQDGFFFNGSFATSYDGNVDDSRLIDCRTGGNGRDGYHLQGADATACTLIGCMAIVNRRYGFFDQSRANTYIGCHGEGNGAPGLLAPIGGAGLPERDDGGHGCEYHTPEGYNTSIFIGCYHEGGSSQHKSVFLGTPQIYGGTIDEQSIHASSTCFVAQGGVAYRRPYRYENNQNGAGNRSFIELGGLGTEPIMLKWGLPDGVDSDYTQFRYNFTTKWWEFQNVSQYRKPIQFPTTVNHSRQAAPYFLHGIFLGGDAAGAAQVSFIAAPSPPNAEYAGHALSYERGDVVWQSQPVAGGELGTRCLTSGTRGTLNGGTTTGNIENGSTQLFVNDANQIRVGQYISIAGVTGKKKVTSVTLNKAALESNAGPYALTDGMTLNVKLDREAVAQTVTLNTADFANIGAATPIEVAAALLADLPAGFGFAITSGGTKVTMSTAVGGFGKYLQVTGGTANAVLGFSTVEQAGSSEIGIDVAAGSDSDVDGAVAFVAPVMESFGEGNTVPTVPTGDAIPVFITLKTLATGESAQIDVLARISSSDGDVRQVFKLSGLYWNNGGTATLDGDWEPIATGTGAADVTIDTSGANVRLKITGIAATDLTTVYELHIL